MNLPTTGRALLIQTIFITECKFLIHAFNENDSNSSTFWNKNVFLKIEKNWIRVILDHNRA